MEQQVQTLVPTQDYFKKWSWILQYSLAMIALTVLQQYAMGLSTPTMKLLCVSALGTGLRILFWLGAGRIFDLKQPAIYAVYVQIALFGVQMVQTWLHPDPYGMREGINLLSVFLKLCNSAPLLVFLWTAFPNRDRLTLILFGLSTPLIGSLWGGSGLSIFDWFLMNEFRFLKFEIGNSTVFLPSYGYQFLNSVAQTMLLGAFVSHLKHFDFGFRDKLVQLDHHYSNAQALLIYWGCKILIMGLVFGVFVDASRVAKGSYGFGATPNTMLLLQFLVFVKTLISLVAVYFLVQYFRKFLLEHLYSRGIVPSFGYWLMAIPILGLLVFASTLIRPLVPISERIQRFEQSAGLNNKDGIITTIVILQLFIMFWRNGFTSEAVITLFISIGFFIFFVYNEKALQIILGIIILAIVYSFLGNNFEQTAMLALTSLYQLIMMYLLIGILHIDTFEYLPALETEEPDLAA